MWWPDRGDGWGFVLASLNSLLFWGLLVAAVILLIRYLGRGAPGRGGYTDHAAERILAERFARGEIDEEEYRQRLSVLRGGYGGRPAG
jgi:putative membrane protein